MPPRKDLGALLIDEDVLDPKDLERLREHRPLWSALIEAELATPEQIFRLLSTRFGVPVVSDERLGEVQLPEPFKRTLSRSEALTAGLLPIDLSGDGQRATVVMVDPSDEATLADFLTMVRVPEGRALLGRRDTLLRAIDRCFGDSTAVVTPLAPPRKRQTGPMAPIRGPIPTPPQTLPPQSQANFMARPVGDDDVTGTVKLDPQLQAEMQRLPRQMLHADPLTPLPVLQKRPRRPTPAGTPTAPPAASPNAPNSPNPATSLGSTPPPPPLEAPESDKEALRNEERLTRALVETVEALASELEARLIGGAGQGAEMARLSRRVGRQLGLSRRAADEIGVAAQLFVLDRLMRNIEGVTSADLFGELGWAAAGEGGLVPMLRSLTAVASGFGRASGGQPPLGTRIIGAVADYVELAASATAPDLDTVSQLLRASPAGATVVDALLRVLESDRGDVTPATPMTATSMLRDSREDGGHDDDTPPTPTATAPREPLDTDKTIRKQMPRKKEGE
jgi:Type II secretion system (T2SS), protein E, N-terminal domain